MTSVKPLPVLLLFFGLCFGLGTAAPAAQPAAVRLSVPSPLAPPTSAPRPAVPTAKPAGPVPPAAGPSVLRLVSQQGEVLLDRGGNGAETTEPLRPAAVLAVHDELSTNHGSVELATATGINLRLSGDGLMVLLSPVSVYLARGDLYITQTAPPAAQRPAAGPNPTTSATPAIPGIPAAPPAAASPASPASLAALSTLVVATPCGRSSVKAREARLRIEGNATVVSVYEGTVQLAGSPPTGVVVNSGQSSRCVKGQPVSGARPLLAAPLWPGGAELLLAGDLGTPTKGTLRWQAVAAAQRYRVDLSRSEAETEIPVSSTDSAAPLPQLEPRMLDKLAVGNYLARVYAIDETGAMGPPSPPHSILLTRVGSLGPEGTARTEEGQLPRISVPRGMTYSVVLDGSPPAAGALTKGAHQLRILIGGLSADLPLQITGKAKELISKAPAPQPADFQGDSTAVWIGSSSAAPDTTPEPVAAQPETKEPENKEPIVATGPEVKAPAESDDLTPQSPGPDDVLLGGVGEVPFDGVRSPWARSYIGGRIESTLSGSLRVVAAGRLVLRNGFGLELSANLLRTAIANLPTGQDAVGFGNINAGMRTPAVRTRHVALQGLVGVVVPLSTSFLDRSIEQDPQAVNPTDGSTLLRPDARPTGGGWRVEPALLLGVRVRRFAISTMQGISLRVSPDVSGSYVGGLLVHTEITPGLRFVTFAAWQVNYVGANGTPGGQTPDVGGATGWGLEALVPSGSRGDLRLALLGRIGLGDGGVAIYGRGAIGLQFGYLFR